MNIIRKWWKEAVIYQIYPRSFKDSDGNGTGDLTGILSQLDYIVWLGVNVVWINPVYASPGEDNGYDISDFRAIDPAFGTMEDLQRLIDGLHAKNIRIIMDMVVNHTSDEHEWFRRARLSRDDPHYTLYHWWPAEKGEPPYRCGFFDPKGRGWQYNEATNAYYLHYFSPHQPDLNWENPELRRRVYDMLRFWLGKGIDGFRMDAITFISKDTTWPEITAEMLAAKYHNDWGHYYAAGPHLHDYLKEMHDEVLKGSDAVIIGESSGVQAEAAPDFVGEERGELDMIYQFEGIMVGYLPGEFKKVDPAGYKLTEFKEVYSRWDKILAGKGWNTLYLGNHDQPRMLSRWGDDRDAWREASAKLLFTFLLTMRGTPSLYNGDELGMTNIRFTDIEDYRDIETRHIYQQIAARGGDTKVFLQDQQLTGRDNSRTPFQWSAGRNAGFTDGEPWIKVNDNYRVINKEAQENDPGSVLSFVRSLIRLRKGRPVLIDGGYRLLNPDDPHVYAYCRYDDKEAVLVLLNFTGEEREFSSDIEMTDKIFINNYTDMRPKDNGIRLYPWQALGMCLKSAFLLLVAIVLCFGAGAQMGGAGAQAPHDSTAAMRDSMNWEQQVTAADRWYKNGILYNLDVHTFQDSDGDGIGDFRGLTARLHYLKSLGVDVIWLAPFQPSPHRDDGYDISDYYGVDSTCGTPGDFQEFLYRAHSLGLRVMMDMVLDHTSDEHPWFRQAAADTNSFRHSWYVWSKEKPPAQHKGMAFPGVQTETWTYNRAAGEYYYHRFYDFQPHLDFRNPEVLAEAQRILGYWLDQGVDGFRLDAVPFIVEVPDKVNDQASHMLSLIPTLRQFVQWRKGDAVLLGEANVPPEENSSYFGKTGEGMNMIFNFYGNQYLFYGLATGDVRPLRRALQATKAIPPVSQWAWFLRMHDEIDLGRLTNEQREKVYQRMGPDKDMQLYNRGIRRRLAPMLHDSAELRMAYSLLFSMPGAPLIRYGEELGMGDDLRLKERLSVRTPMQWTNGKNAGFSTSDHVFRPVISTGEYGYEKVNEEQEDRNPNSLLNFIRRLIRLRKGCPEIGQGAWTMIDSTLDNVLVIRYAYEGRSLIVIHNFSDRPVNMTLHLPGDTGVLDLMTGQEIRSSGGSGGKGMGTAGRGGGDPDGAGEKMVGMAERGGGHIDVSLGDYGFKWFRVTFR